MRVFPLLGAGDWGLIKEACPGLNAGLDHEALGLGRGLHQRRVVVRRQLAGLDAGFDLQARCWLRRLHQGLVVVLNEAPSLHMCLDLHTFSPCACASWPCPIYPRRDRKMQGSPCQSKIVPSLMGLTHTQILLCCSGSLSIRDSNPRTPHDSASQGLLVALLD